MTVPITQYQHGQKVKTFTVSDKDFTCMLINNSLEFSHENTSGAWYKDYGLGVYLVERLRT